jgi:hypothetical protein
LYEDRAAKRAQQRGTIAERVKSLARLVGHMSGACESTHAIRSGNPEGLDVDGLNLNLSEFGWAASELNKFALINAPSDIVFYAFTKYRDLCSPLSNSMDPSVVTTSGLLAQFSADIEALREQEGTLLAEAGRLAP